MNHTKSPSGRTHRLTEPRTGLSVILRYDEAPISDHRVQSDLIRKFDREIHPIVAGILPVFVDHTLEDSGASSTEAVEAYRSQSYRDAQTGIVAALENHMDLIQYEWRDGFPIDTGGLKCICGEWSAPRDVRGLRPHQEFREHVAEAILMVISPHLS